MAYVIAVSNQKGGVGKSTLATNIATACARRSKKALLADRPFVQSVDVETEAFVVRGRVLRERDRFMQVYFNEETGTTAFALIEDEQRIWSRLRRPAWRACTSGGPPGSTPRPRFDDSGGSRGGIG